MASLLNYRQIQQVAYSYYRKPLSANFNEQIPC